MLLGDAINLMATTPHQKNQQRGVLRASCASRWEQQQHGGINAISARNGIVSSRRAHQARRYMNDGAKCIMTRVVHQRDALDVVGILIKADISIGRGKLDRLLLPSRKIIDAPVCSVDILLASGINACNAQSRASS